MITDVWAELGTIFSIWTDHVYPGIQITGLDRNRQQTILARWCKNVRDIEPALNDMGTGEDLSPQSIDEMMQCLLSDDVDGMVWVETYIDGLVLPQIGFFVPSDTTMSIHYISGMWQPVMMIGFFELLRWVHDLDEQIRLKMEEGTAPESWCKQFNRTWNTYLLDKG